MFYSLYGHLDPNFPKQYKVGTKIKKRRTILCSRQHWCKWRLPHLHFQVALTINGLENDWPGVADPDDLGFLMLFAPTLQQF